MDKVLVSDVPRITSCQFFTYSLCRRCTPVPTPRCTPYAGWFGKRTRLFEGRVVWSIRLRRPSRLEDLELLSLREVRGMGVQLILPPPLLCLV